MVCKAWSYAASETLNKTVDLYGYSGVKKFYNCLVNSRRNLGPLFKEIKIIKRRYPGSPVAKEVYLNLLTTCTNLQYLIFSNMNPRIYLKCMAETEIEMSNIKHIYIHLTSEKNCMTVICKLLLKIAYQ